MQRTRPNRKYHTQAASRCLLTIADLQSEVQDLKYNMEDMVTTAARVKRDFGYTERKYVAVRSDLSNTKIELFQTTETLNRVSTELKDIKEDLKYQTSLVQSSFKENQSIYTQHRDQRSTIQELRAALKDAQNKKNTCNTTPTSCQTTMDIVALMNSVHINPTESKGDPPPNLSWVDNMEKYEHSTPPNIQATSLLPDKAPSLTDQAPSQIHRESESQPVRTDTTHPQPPVQQEPQRDPV